MKFFLIATSITSITNFRGKLLDEINSIGYKIHIILPVEFKKTKEARELIEHGYIIHFIPLLRTKISIFNDLKSLLLLVRIIKFEKPDIVMSYTIKPVIYGSIAAKISGINSIYSLITGLGYAFNNVEEVNHKITLMQRIIFILYKFALICSKKVIFQNKDDANLFEKLNLVNSKKVYVVNGSGVDLSHYNYDLTILEEYTSEQSIKFLMLGRIIGDKGIREYIEASKYLKEKYGTKVIFQLAGGLDSNPSAIQKKELDEWINAGTIEYLGKLKDVRPAITASHVFVLPSYREGTSRSILEAMSIGRPIITTNVAGCKQLVEVGYNGYLAEAKSAESLIEAIEKILKLSSSDLVDMGIFSRKIVEDKYDVHKVNEHMLDIMDIK